MKIFQNQNDTLNYKVLQFFNTGELLSSWTYVNGELDGGFRVFSPKGILVEQGTYKNGKKVGVYLEHDTSGIVIGESYFIENKRIIYSVSWFSENKKIFGQTFHHLRNDTAYEYGQIAKEIDNDRIIKEMSWNSSIVSKDTISELPFFLTLTTIFPVHCDRYNVTFGTPNTNLDFISIDTTFVTTDSVITICNLKLKTGTNHVFCKVQAFSEYNPTFYAFKDVYLSIGKK